MRISADRPRGADTQPRRLTWLDLLRGTAVLLVMANHAVNMAHVDGWNMPKWMIDVTRSFEPFRLPMLLVVSGLFLPRALTKPIGTYISGKARNLLWPLLLWAPVTVFTHIPDLASERAIWLGPSHLWYLVTLLFCYAVALLAHKLGLGKKWFPAWVIVVILLALLFNVFPSEVNLLWFGSFFFAGAAIAAHVRRFQDAHWLVFAALAAITVTGSRLHVLNWTGGQSILTFAIALAGCGAMIWLAPRIPRVGLVRWLEAVGRKSVVYYVVHLPVIAVLYNIIQPLGVRTELAVGSAAVLAFVVPFVLTRIPGHNLLFSFPARRRPTPVASPTPARELSKSTR